VGRGCAGEATFLALLGPFILQRVVGKKKPKLSQKYAGQAQTITARNNEKRKEMGGIPGRFQPTGRSALLKVVLGEAVKGPRTSQLSRPLLYTRKRCRIYKEVEYEKGTRCEGSVTP